MIGFKLEVDEREYVASFALEKVRAKRAVTNAMATAQARLTQRWRGQIRQNLKGERLPNSVQGATYPRGDISVNAAAMVWVKSPKVIAAHEQGGTIVSSGGAWLAIPTDAAGLGSRGKRMTPAMWERMHRVPLRFVYRPGRASLLVANDARLKKSGIAKRKLGRRRKTDGILTGAQTVPIFILVPSVQLRKRLNLAEDAQVVASQLAADIAANWPE
ncbi:DUF6441 family protein [Pseudoroseicyclus sp. CXY001]|uniref:DUF6441 family protein n=1 Tax=Pseudoroseicyclus sp. CXY001 TaxID=3242492 RepID=UPI003570B813